MASYKQVQPCRKKTLQLWAATPGILVGRVIISREMQLFDLLEKNDHHNHKADGAADHQGI
ncbi:MAG: hypothetical protein R6U91_05780 [Bacillota bacterium]